MNDRFGPEPGAPWFGRGGEDWRSRYEDREPDGPASYASDPNRPRAVSPEVRDGAGGHGANGQRASFRDRTRAPRRVFGYVLDLGDLEPEYRRHHLNEDASQAAVFYAIWLVAGLGMIYFDHVVLGTSDAFRGTLGIRLVSSALVVGYLFAVRRIASVARYEWMSLALATVLAVSVLLVNATRPSDYIANFVLDILLPISMFLVVPNRLLFSSLSAAAFTAADLASLLLWRPGVQPMVRNVIIVTHCLALFLGWLMAARVNTFRRREFRLYQDEITSRRIIERIAHVDDLTGCLTRRSFLAALGHEFRRSRRFLRKLTVVLMDLDGFKAVNDCHGHHAGDELLRRFASAVSSQKREIDVFGRVGGEEFALVLPETSLEGATLLAERIRASWADTQVPFEDVVLRSTVSLGVTALRPTDEEPDAVLRRADRLLYDAKRAGRNCVAVEAGSAVQDG